MVGSVIKKLQEKLHEIRDVKISMMSVIAEYITEQKFTGLKIITAEESIILSSPFCRAGDSVLRIAGRNEDGNIHELLLSVTVMSDIGIDENGDLFISAPSSFVRTSEDVLWSRLIFSNRPLVKRSISSNIDSVD